MTSRRRAAMEPIGSSAFELHDNTVRPQIDANSGSTTTECLIEQIGLVLGRRLLSQLSKADPLSFWFSHVGSFFRHDSKAACICLGPFGQLGCPNHVDQPCAGFLPFSSGEPLAQDPGK